MLAVAQRIAWVWDAGLVTERPLEELVRDLGDVDG